MSHSKEVHLDDVLYSLRNYGVAIFLSLIKGDQLNRLQNEFKLFMSKTEMCLSHNSEGADAGNSLAMVLRSQLNDRCFLKWQSCLVPKLYSRYVQITFLVKILS